MFAKFLSQSIKYKGQSNENRTPSIKYFLYKRLVTVLLCIDAAICRIEDIHSKNAQVLIVAFGNSMLESVAFQQM